MSRLVMRWCLFLLLMVVVAHVPTNAQAVTGEWMRVVLHAAPSAPFSPNGDGLADTVAIRTVLSIKGSGQATDVALWGTMTIADPAGRSLARRELVQPISAPPGRWSEFDQVLVWDGKTEAGAVAVDGDYRYAVEFALRKVCKGNGDNRDDSHSGQIDLSGDCNSGAGNDDSNVKLIGHAGPLFGTVVLDNTPPTITLAGVVDGQVCNTAITPVVTLVDPHLARQSVLLNDQPYVSGTRLSEEGMYRLAISATDTAGNAAQDSIGFTIDTTPPNVAITAPLTGSHVDSSTPQFTIEYADPVSGIDLSRIVLTVDGKSLDIEDPTLSGLNCIPRETLEEGMHTLVATVFDRAGNKTEVSSSFTVKSRCTIVPPPANNTFPPLIYPEPGFDTKTYQGPYDFGTFSQFQIGDLNRDGIPDMVGVDSYSTASGYYKTRLTVMLGLGDGRFEKKFSFAEMENSSAIAGLQLGDFDADCNLDLAVTRDSPHELYVYLGLGDGTFRQQARYPLDAPSRLIGGRFNGDKHEDLVAYSASGTIRLFAGNGDGTFTLSSTFDVESNDSKIIDMVVVDSNEDNIVDIVAVVGNLNLADNWYYGKEVVLLTGSRDGEFLKEILYSATDDQEIGNIVVGDIDGNGHDDIVVVQYSLDDRVTGSMQLTALLGYGDGTFELIDNDLWQDEQHVRNANHSALAFNVDGDTRDDVVLGIGNELLVFGSAGNGTFAAAKFYPLSNSQWLKSGDFDGDGDVDVVTASDGRFGYVLLNNGAGTFIAREIVNATRGASLVSSADFDGDNRPDLVTSTTYCGNDSLFSTRLNSDDNWSTEPFHSNLSTSYEIIGKPTKVKNGDLNNDGKIDVVTINSTSGTIAVLMNKGTGILAGPVYYTVGQSPAELALSDFNQDGRLDVVTANSVSGTISVSLGNGDGTFRTQTTYEAGKKPKGLVVADLNRDGAPDIAVSDSDWSADSIRIYLGKDDGTFIQQTSVTVAGFGPDFLDVRDFNSDGYPDLVVSYYRSTGWSDLDAVASVFFGTGDGTFLQTQSVLPTNLIVENKLVTGDYNEDGMTDIVTFDVNSGRITVQLNHDNQTYSIKQVMTQDALNTAVSGDINADGHEDLIIGDVNMLSTWLGRGDGTFERGPAIGGYSVESTTIGDIDSDGIADLVAVDGLKLFVVRGIGAGVFHGDTVIKEDNPYTVTGLATGDFNKDGNQDVVLGMYPSAWCDYPTDYAKIRIYWGNGNNFFRQGPDIITNDYNIVLIASDVDTDGKMDIVTIADDITVYLNDGNGQFHRVMSLTDEFIRRYVRLNDVTGDGYPDLICDIEKNFEWGLASYQTKIFKGNGDGTFNELIDVPLGYRPWDWNFYSQFGDLNSDGLFDLIGVFENFDEYETVVHLNGDTNFYDPRLLSSSPNSGDLSDFDNDGKLDLLTSMDQLTEVLAWQHGNGDGTFSSPVHFSAWSVGPLLLRDFNLDGRVDIAMGSYRDIPTISFLYNTLPPLVTPPSSPANLKAVAGNAVVALTWADNRESDLAGYNVYRRHVAGGNYEKLNSSLLSFPSFTDYAVSNGSGYYYTVAAVDQGGDESGYAVKVRATPTLPDTTPPTITIVTPAANRTVTTPALFVTGTVNETDARVTVNGVPATIQTASRTYTAYGVPLAVGGNTLVATAVDRSGNSATTSQQVIYTPTAMITGVVRSESTGLPVANALVWVRDAVKEQTFTTAADGYFAVVNVVPGRVDLTIEGTDYARVTQIHEIAPGAEVALDIVLPLSPATVRAWLYDSGTYNFLTSATVTVNDAKQTQTVTVEDGILILDNIAPYQAAFTVTAPGYSPYTTTRTLSNRWSNYLYFYLDPLPPTAPSAVSATAGAGYVELAWAANGESNLDGYRIYRSTTPGSGYQLLATVARDTLSYLDGQVESGIAYDYVLTAVNSSAQASGYSAEVTAIPLALSIPGNLVATPGQGAVTLSWTPCADDTISGYRLYRSHESGTGHALLSTVAASSSSYIDRDVTAGTSYSYVVSAVNRWGREGGRSDEVMATPELVTLAVTLTAPDVNSELLGPQIMVRGLIESTAAEVGVVVLVESFSKFGTQSAGYPAEVSGRAFAAQIPIPSSGTNTITAIATGPGGDQARASVTVFIGGGTAPLTLAVQPPSELVTPQTGTFEARFTADYVGSGVATGYAWDFDGDGRVDRQTSEPNTTFAYSSPGLYYPTVTATVGADPADAGGKESLSGMTHVAGALVNALSYEEMSRLLDAKWADMKGALARGDIERAVANFTEGSRDSFRQQFTLLTKALPQIVAEMGQATLVEARNNWAIFDLRTIRNRRVLSFQLEFVRDGDGIWRIRGF